MRAQIHPQYNDTAAVICSCGNQFNVGSTKGTIHVELCYNCHPFYTGQQKFVDTASRIQKFEDKMKAKKIIVKKETERKEDDGPKSLKEMLAALKKK
ncbi:MAG: 50S ribosomal protein L31 [Candidatus Levybacteria bacterium]|nr:50S ribosomal protein L31 [Candidatus Levybacteria bacterium]MBP9815383.1 50S ribosomal protein L31 [Candidatus Levybacteria bacterium]